YSNADALGEKTAQSGRSRVLSLSQMTATKPRWKLAPSEIRRITVALSSSERERPSDKAAVRLDWAELAERLDMRLQKIVAALAIGETKSAIAKQLGISASRVTQLMRDLASKIADFFGL